MIEAFPWNHIQSHLQRLELECLVSIEDRVRMTASIWKSYPRGSVWIYEGPNRKLCLVPCWEETMET